MNDLEFFQRPTKIFKTPLNTAKKRRIDSGSRYDINLETLESSPISSPRQSPAPKSPKDNDHEKEDDLEFSFAQSTQDQEARAFAQMLRETRKTKPPEEPKKSPVVDVPITVEPFWKTTPVLKVVDNGRGMSSRKGKGKSKVNITETPTNRNTASTSKKEDMTIKKPLGAQRSILDMLDNFPKFGVDDEIIIHDFEGEGEASVQVPIREPVKVSQKRPRHKQHKENESPATDTEIETEKSSQFCEGYEQIEVAEKRKRAEGMDKLRAMRAAKSNRPETPVSITTKTSETLKAPDKQQGQQEHSLALELFPSSPQQQRQRGSSPGIHNYIDTETEVEEDSEDEYSFTEPHNALGPQYNLGPPLNSPPPKGSIYISTLPEPLRRGYEEMYSTRKQEENVNKSRARATAAGKDRGDGVQRMTASSKKFKKRSFKGQRRYKSKKK